MAQQFNPFDPLGLFGPTRAPDRDEVFRLTTQARRSLDDAAGSLISGGNSAMALVNQATVALRASGETELAEEARRIEEAILDLTGRVERLRNFLPIT